MLSVPKYGALGERVLPEDPRWHSKAALDRPELIGLLQQWHSWTGGGTIPLRSQFDPVDFPRLLPWMVLAEVLVEGPAFDARMRFIGSEFVQYFNSEKMTKSLLGRPAVDIHSV